VGITHFEVSYARPSMRERVIFGDLVPYGEVWRAGANAATKVTVSTAFTFGTTPVAAGTYAWGKFVWLITLKQNKSKNNDMLGVWPLHGICGAWGGLGGVSLPVQILGTLGEVATDLAGSAAVYGALKMAWDCGSIRRRSSWAPISAATRCQPRRSARPAGSSATPLLQVIASFDCQLFELAIDEHDVRMLFGVFQQQLGALQFQLGLFTIQT
jgi:hypothetical protein